jgi:hypothetical protein
VVKGVTCLDHYLRVTRPGRPAAYSWPSYQYRVGEGGRWTACVSTAGSAPRRIEAETKPECIYNICESLLGTPPGFNNFIKWYSYPVGHSETSRMTSTLEHVLELLPLQNHIDRQLFTNRVPIVLEVFYPGVRYLIFAISKNNFFHRPFVRQLSSYQSSERWRLAKHSNKSDCTKMVFLSLFMTSRKGPDLLVLLIPFNIFRRNKVKNRHYLCRLLLERKIRKNESTGRR